MIKSQIEARVLNMIRSVVDDGQCIEDDFVEAKSTWIEPVKAARRIAALANAARGEPVLWLVGLDEDGHAVVDPGDEELADWWARVESRFEDVSPDLVTLVVHTDHGAVTCLQFDTDRAPYIVRVGNNNAVDREMPWRAGTRTRTATRAEMLTTLAPAVDLPGVTLLNLEVIARNAHLPNRVGDKKIDNGNGGFEVTADAFFSAQRRVFLPAHLRTLTITYLSSDPLAPDAPKSTRHAETLSFTPHRVSDTGFVFEPEYSFGVVSRTAGLAVNGADSLAMNAWVPVNVRELRDIAFLGEITVELSFGVDRSARIVRIERVLQWKRHPDASPDGPMFCRWTARDDDDRAR